MFNQESKESDRVFPRQLNRLATTTKSGEQICLVLERAPGIDLVTFNKLLQPKLKWEPDQNVFEFSRDLELFLKHIAIQVLIGLEALHDAAIIYKDLKASHVFLDDKGQVTIIDFGLSEVVSDGLSSIGAGTLHAMSPEMVALYSKQSQSEKIDY